MAGSGTKARPVPELAVIGAGALGFVSSLLPWYRGSVSVFGFTGSVEVNAWNAGAAAWLSVLLVVGAGAVALACAMIRPRRVPVWGPLLAAGLATLALVCLVARWASWRDTTDGVDGLAGVQLDGSSLGGLVGASAGPTIGFYLALTAVAVALVASWTSARAALASS